MNKFSDKQLNRASEIIGNISVAWFSGGVIAPLIARPFRLIEFLVIFVISLFMTGLFFIKSLEIIKRPKKI